MTLYALIRSLNLNHMTTNSQLRGLMFIPSLVCRRWSHLVCRLLGQFQPQPWQPLQRVPDTVAVFTLPALISRGGYLHRDWGIETEGRWVHHPILQTGVPVPRGLQWTLSSTHSTTYLCTPHRRKKAMRVSRNFHKLVLPHCPYV